MKILYYSPVINVPTGGGTHARGLAAGMTACGHQVRTIPPIESADGAVGECRNGSSPLPDALKAWGRELRGRLRVLRDGGRTLAEAREFAPDVLVVRRPAYDLLADSLVAGLGCPVVVETNAVYHLESDAWGERLLPVEVARENACFRAADVVSCISDEVAADVRRAAAVADSVRVCSNGVDADAFAPEGPRDHETSRWAERCDGVIGYCGGLSPLHDLPTIAAAADAVVRKRPNAGFLFVGADEEGLAPLLSPAVRERSRITGPVAHSHVAALLRSSDVFWAAFPYDYPSPLKVYEYLSLARPVVVAGYGLPERVIRASGAGCAVARADAAALAEGALRYLADPGLSASAGASGREWVCANATWQKVAEAMLEGVAAR